MFGPLALGLAFVVGRQTMVLKRPSALPPIPVTMPSLLGPVPVERVDSIPGDPDALADVRFMRRVVRIRTDLSLAGAWHAYYHEACHLWLYDSHASLGGDEEERTCDVWGTARVADLLNG